MKIMIQSVPFSGHSVKPISVKLLDINIRSLPLNNFVNSELQKFSVLLFLFYS